MYNKNIVCLSEILASIGYQKLFALTGTEDVMGFGFWREVINFTKLVQTKNDLYLSNYIADEFLPMINDVIQGKKNLIQVKSQINNQNKRQRRRRKRKEINNNNNNANSVINININKFVLYIRPEDTHIPYMRPKWCMLNNVHLESFEKCFNCVDFAINKIIQKFLDLKMYENTVLAVYPDHTPFVTPFSKENNHLYILFPGMEKVNNII